MDSWTFTPIGIVTSTRRNRYDAPRQGTLDEEHTARVVLDQGRNFEQAIQDLEGFERIWLVYVFHLNEGWKPRVHVPRHRDDKVGVFATRAPYRPNPVGISCVRLLGIEGRTLHIAECDLLDGTPVLDIKPYLPYADSFPDAATGWVPRSEALYEVRCGARAEAQIAWLNERGVNIMPFARTQLEASPCSGERKRIRPVDDAADTFVLAYRTWRLRFHIDEGARVVEISEVFSGYSAADLDTEDDRHEDKDIHRQFNNHAGPPWPNR